MKMPDFDRLISEAPETRAISEPTGASEPGAIHPATRVPRRYRGAWERPSDSQWLDRFSKVLRIVDDKNLLGLIGPRGTGKTRLACEAIRERFKETAIYTTAMQFFVRVRSSYRKQAELSEEEIIEEYADAPLLVIDEIQERGESSWEDRLLTHLIDRRYGNMRPTIIIGNLLHHSLEDSLGQSVCDRMNEGGGILVIDGKSHRK